MSKVLVIGAGASGIIASLVASKNNEVILLEGNDKVGKKILITGNGRCNYWNSDISTKHYGFDRIDYMKSILDNKDVVFDYLTSLGIYPRIRNGYYYPNSNQASSVQEIFSKALVNSNVNIVYNCKVCKIEKKDNKFIIKSNLEDIECDKVIVAAGGSSYPKTGSDGSGFKLLEEYHTINKPLPSLVPLVTKEKIKDWANVRVDASIELYIGNEENSYADQIGEIQLTDYGISGIPVFNISGDVSRALYGGFYTYAYINFLPDVEDVYKFLNDRNKNIINHTVVDLLESVLPYQVAFVLLRKADINRDLVWDNVSEDKKRSLVNLISQFKVEFEDTLSFDRSQVTTGGVPLSEINPETMESLKVPGLYIVGELLDVDGNCGGFNLGFAFITGYIAGRGI